ncbi:MAG: ribosome maturation factor RimM [Hyphomicrobiaceae bacterium]
MSDTAKDRVLLGRIAAAHGIRGDVVVHSFAADPVDIASYGPLGDAGGTRSFKLKVRHVTDKGVICGIAGITDRTAAEALRGVELYVARDRLPDTSEDEFYHADLIGLTAVDPDGVRIGRIADVVNYGAGDLIEIARDGSTKTELIPFREAFVPEVDVAGGRVVVRMPDVAADDDESPEKT